MKFQFSLRAKIISICLIIATIGGLLVGYGIFVTQAVSDEFSHVSEINLPNAEALGGLESLQKDVLINLSLWASNNKTKTYEDKAREAMAAYLKIDKWYQEIPFVEGEDALYQNVSQSWKTFSENVENTFAGKSEVTATFEASEKFDSYIKKLITFQSDQAKTWSQRAKDRATQARTLQLIALLIVFLASTATSIIFGRKIADRIQDTVLKLTENAAAVSAASTQIASSSNSLSEATTEQSAALQQTAASLEQISAMVKKSSDSSQATSKSAAESQDQVEEGRAAVGQMFESMEQISQSNNTILGQVRESNQRMQEITKIIDEISSKTRVINDIVFQTKLLSFNASVEAARAGEYGKGFSVVAEEVGNLAQMSGKAAKEISDLLSRSTVSVNEIARETKEKVENLVLAGKEKVDSGITTAQRCSEILQEIVGKVSQVSGLSQEISMATKEQSDGVSEINKAMSQLDQVTQQNASTSQETATSAESLAKQAELLKGSVNELISLVDGTAA